MSTTSLLAMDIEPQYCLLNGHYVPKSVTEKTLCVYDIPKGLIFFFFFF